MSLAFIQLVRTLAREAYPGSHVGKPSEHEQFNLTAFMVAAFGKPNRNKWIRWVEKPYTLRLEDAEKMARALGRSFAGMVADSQAPNLQTLAKKQLLTCKQKLLAIEEGNQKVSS